MAMLASTWHMRVLADCVVFTKNGKQHRAFEFDPKKRKEVEALLAEVDERALRCAMDLLLTKPGLVTRLPQG
jgi:hypothetical protein